MNKILISIFFIGLLYNSFAFKSKEDSLVYELNKCKVDTLKFKISEKLYYLNSKKGDFNAAKLYKNKLINYANQINTSNYSAISLYITAHYFYKTLKLDSAIIYSNKAIDVAKQNKNYAILIKSNGNLGNIYSQRSDLKSAITYFLSADKYAEFSENKTDKINTTINLGVVFYQMSDYKTSIEYFRKSIQYSIKLPDSKSELLAAYNNIATIFLNEKPKQVDSALYYYNEVLKIAIEINDRTKIAISYFNLAEALRRNNEYSKAEDFYIKSKMMYEDMKDSLGIARVFLGIADNYNEQDKHYEAITALKKGITYCKTEDMISSLTDFYKTLGNSLYQINSYKEAYDYYSLGTNISDSLYNIENSKILYELQTKYETAEKEKQNISLKSQNEISQKTIKQQKIISYFIVGSLLLSVLFGFYVFQNLKKQRKANKIISLQKTEVEKQKHLVEEHQKEILDSIHYAKRIQNTLLANKEFVNTTIKSNFIYFQPKDIVSGDFYWATQQNNCFYLACCDSTGHGVPGAFMSLLNIGFLSEAIKEKNISQPNEIFNYVRQRLIDSISAEGQKDGFDGILIKIKSSDLQSNQSSISIEYSAANNEPILISNNQIIELPKDKMPVGQGERKESFALHTLELKKEETLYLYTDGYADQFGGEKGKKFKYKQLNELLLQIHQLPMHEQEQKLSTTFNNWKGNLEQVDDVCVIGLRV